MTELTRDEWLIERKKSIGASEVAKVLGVDPYGGPLSVYEAKTTDYQIEDNLYMETGRLLEETAARKYAEETGRVVTNPGATLIQYHPDYPWLSATLDRWVSDYGKPAFEGPLEIKTFVSPRISPDDWVNEPLIQHQLQLQIQMAVTGAKWGSLAGLFLARNKFVWVTLERDDELLEGIYPVLSEFWQRVIDRDPPPPDALPDTLDVVKRLYPVSNSETIDLSNFWLESADELARKKDQLSSLNKEIKILETSIRAVIGNAEIAQLSDGTSLTLKTTKRKAYTKVVEAGEYRTLRRTKAKK